MLHGNGRNKTLRVVIQRPVGFSQHTKKVGPYSPNIRSPPASRDQALPLPGTTEPLKRHEEKVKTQNTVIPGISPCSASAPYPKIVKLPKVRVFVCGSEAEKCASQILHSSDIEIVFRNYGYTSVEFSMATDSLDNIVISRICSNLFMTSSYVSELSATCSKSSDDSKCKGCGNEFHHNLSQKKLQSVINVEMHIVLDDKLIHNCSNYLFTKTSVFLLTFDCEKLLRTKTELTRMLNLSHTIRSFSDECHISMLGFLENLESSSIRDEVQALFLGPYNTQLQQYNVNGPDLFDMQCIPTGASNFSEKHDLQLLLWRSISDSVQRLGTTVQPLLKVLDYLYTIKDRELVVTEDSFMSVIRSILAEYDVDVHYYILTELDLFREIIRGSKLLIALYIIIFIRPS